MTNADLSGIRQDFDPYTNVPIVLIRFTARGRRTFLAITRAEARRGTRLAARTADPVNALQHFAIVLDEEIRSFPSIDFHQYPDGIDPTNGVQITGIGSLKEARDLAIELRAGPLPLKFVLVRSGRL
jgi:preprotein translocase subunit SecD